MRRDETLTYITSAGAKVVFATDSALSPFWWEQADGLTGLDNDITTVSGSGQDGESFVSARLAARTITIEGRIVKNQDANRRKLLSLMDPWSLGKLVYAQGPVTRYIPACVKKLPEVGRGIYPAFHIEFFAPNPFWREGSGAKQVADIAVWIGNTEFPLEILADGLELCYRTQSLIANIKNTGDAATGMTVVFRANGTTSNPELINVRTQQRLSVRLDMVAGDVLTISTGYGEKRATLLRSGAESNVFNRISGTWLNLARGDNLLRYDSTDPDALEVSIYYDVPYLGV
ncbi:MAG: phage tail family protein [Christensenellales bacterium]|jgi:hypothetical protein